MSSDVSEQNSTRLPLGADETFTGTPEKNGLPDLMITLKSSSAGTLYVDFSVDDGANWDTQLPFKVGAGAGEFHTFVKGTRSVRVRFVNGSTAQTYFRMQSEFGTFRQGNLPVNAQMSDDADAISVRPTIAEDETVLGLRAGQSASLKFGYNPDVSAAGPEVVAAFGGTFTPLETATTLTVSSSDAADTSAGTGARSILISGLDANRLAQSEVLTMNGTSSVVTAATWLGVNRVVVLSCGSAKVNAGIITCTATTGGATQASIPLGASITQQLIFHTQAGHEGLIKSVNINVLKISGGASPRVTAYLKVFNPGVTGAIYTLRRFKLDTSSSNDITRAYRLPIYLSPTDVVWLEVETNTNSTIVDAEMAIEEHKLAST